MDRTVIGGDFELGSLALGSPARLATLSRGMPGTWTASGRAALGLVLRQLKSEGISQVHLPAYLCESILQPVQELAMDYSFYPVDENLKAHPAPPANSAVLLIHYFGWLNPATPALRAEAGKSFYLIEDASQALLSDWSASNENGRAVILSPRKFGPTVLGGWCSMETSTFACSSALESNAWRSLAARLARRSYLAQSNGEIDSAVEDFYLAGFRAVEDCLDTQSSNSSAPEFVLQLIAGINWTEVTARRRANWNQLNQLLSNTVNPVNSSLPESVTPLGYVARFNERDVLRKKLAAQRIYCPVHWPLPAEVSPQRFPEAAALAQSCVTLPIDQRYNHADMERLAGALKKFTL